MGTGGFHSGGGGGGIGGGTGVVGGGAGGGYVFVGGRPRMVELGLREATERVDAVIASLHRNSKEYLRRQLCGPLIDGLFRELFEIDRCLQEPDPAAALAQRYKIPADKPFIFACGNALMNSLATNEDDERIRSAARMCFEGFMRRTLGAKAARFGTATTSLYAAIADRGIYTRLTGHFLGILFSQLIKREVSGLSAPAEIRLARIVQERADKVVASFEERFGRSYPDLLATIRDNDNWFRSQIT